ncbi:MAG: peptide chain release factor N(5)-glutamine methyltransferase [Ruminococcaceae bacterium]|nr:peptide chain release factor N(5)-glutamine methyltransferase [Oscillospiraceae bacterium]
MTYGDVLKLLTGSGDEEAQLDARILCEELEGEALSLAAGRRAKGEPLAYILGHRHFWREDYKVVPGVLIPRPDTELLVESALRFMGCHELATGDVLDIPVSGFAGKVSFADICTGTGCVGISVANGLLAGGLEVEGVLTDISPVALDIAGLNAKGQLKDSSVLKVVRNDILKDELPDGLNFVVSNPPYITDSEMEELDIVVKDHEPDLALRGGTDGLDFYGSIFEKSYAALVPGGAVFAEHGYLQGEQVRMICRKAGFAVTGTVRDYGGNERVTWGIKNAG